MLVICIRWVLDFNIFKTAAVWVSELRSWSFLASSESEMVGIKGHFEVLNFYNFDDVDGLGFSIPSIIIWKQWGKFHLPIRKEESRLPTNTAAAKKNAAQIQTQKMA